MKKEAKAKTFFLVKYYLLTKKPISGDLLHLIKVLTIYNTSKVHKKKYNTSKQMKLQKKKEIEKHIQTEKKRIHI